MKSIFSICVFLLMLGVAAAQQSTNSSSVATNSIASNTMPRLPNFGGSPFAATNSVTSKTFEETKANAEKGDVKAQVAMGAYYFSVTNYVDAAKWIHKAAEQGSAMAQAVITVCYEAGFGVAQDDSQAAEWYDRAAQNKDKSGIIFLLERGAEAGDSDAQSALGITYYTQCNYVGALQWLHKSGEQGNSKAQLYLYYCYANGEGVQTNANEAAKWIREAAQNGESTAQGILGMLYSQKIFDCTNDTGLIDFPQDYAQAVKWFRRGANQGNTHAQAALGWCYKKGQGVPKNQVEAYKWFNLAAAQNKEDAVKKIAEASRDLLAYDMSPAEITEAQRLSAAFVPRKETPGSNSSSGSPVAADSPIATGTGFYITDNGYLISNNHVVKDATKVRLLTSGGLIDAKVVRVDAANDLALLKASGKCAALPVASSRAVHLGNSVATVGFPNIGMQGFAPKFARGEIASLSGAADDARYFQISVPVQPGNSGGALVDEHGNVVGVVSAKLNASAALATSGQLPENVNYAVKSSFLLSFLESVPAVSAKLKEPVTADRKFEDVVKSAQEAAVLVLVY